MWVTTDVTLLDVTREPQSREARVWLVLPIKWCHAATNISQSLPHVTAEKQPAQICH